MAALVSYQLQDEVATVTLDDGKVNALSLSMLGQIDAALDRAAEDDAIVVLTGRPGVFSAGFDLAVLRGGGEEEAHAMLRAGFELAARVLSYSKPVVIACTGHAVAMGAFLLLSGDYRIGAAGPYKITANEVAIGLTMPRTAIELCRQRLTPAHFNRATVIAEVYAPDGAVEAGFLDRLSGESELAQAALGIAQRLRTLDMKAHLATKARVRSQVMAAVRGAIDLDYAHLTAGTAA